MKPNKEHIITEMLQEIEKGSNFTQCSDFFDLVWSLPSSTFKRYWKIASDRHRARQEATQTALAEYALELEKEGLKRAILSKHERMEILTQIALGEIPMVKHMVVDKYIEEVDIAPSWKDRKEAIAELNKMEGDYAPLKKDITTNGDSIAPAPVFRILLDDDGEL